MLCVSTFHMHYHTLRLYQCCVSASVVLLTLLLSISLNEALLLLCTVEELELTGEECSSVCACVLVCILCVSCVCAAECVLILLWYCRGCFLGGAPVNGAECAV